MKLLLLDKDGTLVKPKSGEKFTTEPWDQEPLPGVQAALSRHVAEGWFPVIDIHGGSEMLMVGDRPEDYTAAAGASARFLWAFDWVKGDV